ncbi:MAG: DUF2911 domain-containing protein, partial [Longimicrobiales bacterium]
SLATAGAMLLGCAAAAAAQTADSAMYIVRLGIDTVAIERWVMPGAERPDSLHVVSVTRSPRTIVRRYVVRFDDAGRVTYVSTGPQGPAPTATSGAVPIAGGTYAPYAVAVWYAMRAGTAEHTVPMLVGSSTRDVVVQRRAAGEYTLPNQFGVPLTVLVAPHGAVTSIDAGGGSTFERVDWFDLEALTREFAARDASGTGLGMLSPRDTTRATVAGAKIVIDYSRPSARGRTVLGGLVPYGEVWRTGANEATQLITTAPICVGSVCVEAGRYSLFTIPRAGAWELIINRRTGMSGLEHDPSQDVGRVSLQPAATSSHTEQFTIRLDPAPMGARLRFMWGDADVSVPVRRQ